MGQPLCRVRILCLRHLDFTCWIASGEGTLSSSIRWLRRFCRMIFKSGMASHWIQRYQATSDEVQRAGNECPFWSGFAASLHSKQVWPQEGLVHKANNSNNTPCQICIWSTNAESSRKTHRKLLGKSGALLAGLKAFDWPWFQSLFVAPLRQLEEHLHSVKMLWMCDKLVASCECSHALKLSSTGWV